MASVTSHSPSSSSLHRANTEQSETQATENTPSTSRPPEQLTPEAVGNLLLITPGMILRALRGSKCATCKQIVTTGGACQVIGCVNNKSTPADATHCITYPGSDNRVDYLAQCQVTQRRHAEEIPSLFIQKPLFFEPMIQAVWKGGICKTVISNETDFVTVTCPRSFFPGPRMPIHSFHETQWSGEPVYSTMDICQECPLVPLSFLCDEGPFLSALHAHYHFAEAASSTAGEILLPPLASVSEPKIENLERENCWLQLPHYPLVEVIIPARVIETLVRRAEEPIKLEGGKEAASRSRYSDMSSWKEERSWFPGSRGKGKGRRG